MNSFRLKSIDMFTTSGKCNNAPFSQSRLVDVVKIVHIAPSPQGMILD